MPRFHRGGRRLIVAVTVLALGALLAPGSAQAVTPAATVTLLSQAFSTGALPAGWKMVNQSDGQAGWQFADPGHRGNQTGGTGDFAIIDSAWVYAGGGGSAGTVHASLVSPYLTKSANSVVTVSFSTRLLTTTGFDTSSLQWSLDKGKTWTTAWTVTDTSIAAGTRLSVPLPGAVAAAKHLTVRWTNRSFKGGYWEVDDVSVTAG